MINADYFWFNIIILAIGTFIIRGFLIFLSSRIKFSQSTKDMFSFIPVSILPAMVAPMVYFHQGHVSFLLGKERLFVLFFATIFCYIFKSMIWTIVFGLLFLYFLNQF